MTKNPSPLAGIISFQSLADFVFCFDGRVFTFERGRVYRVRGDLVAALQDAGLPILA